MGVNVNAAAALLAKRKAERDSGGGSKGGDRESDIQWLTLPKEQCEVTLRFLPPVAGKELPGKMVKVHFGIPLEGKGENKIDSMIDTLGEDRDPMEQVLKKYRKLLDTADFEYTTKFYAHVLVKSIKVKGVEIKQDPFNKKDYDFEKPFILSMYGEHNFYWLLERLVDADLGDITDPLEGTWFKFIRKENGGKWERSPIPYQRSHFETPFGTAIANSQEKVDALLASMQDMDKIFKPRGDDYLPKAKKAAEALDKLLSSKLAIQQATEASMNQNAGEKIEELTPAKAAPEEVKTAPAPKLSRALDAPSGSPACFGDSTQLYAGFASEDEALDAELNEAQKKLLHNCQICPYETECASRIPR